MRHIVMYLFVLLMVWLAAGDLWAASGQPSWTITYPETEAPYFVRISGTAQVVVVGRYYVQSPENAQIFAHKYRRDSTVVWNAMTTGADLKIPIAAGLDQAGNVYVLAQYENDNTSPVVLYKFGADDGVIDWEESFYPAGDFRQTAARDLFVMPDGRSLVCANFVIDDPAHPLRSDIQSYLLYFDAAGNLERAVADYLSEPSVSFERVKANSSIVYVTGSLTYDTGDYDGFVAGFNFDGDSLWTHYSGLDPTTGVFLQGVALDSAGNNFVAFANADSTSYRKYDSSGNFAFDRRDIAHTFPYQNELAADPTGNFYYMIGDFSGNQRLQKRDPTGVLVLDTTLGAGFIPFPVVYSRDGSLLTWNPAFRAAQYGLDGAGLWISDDTFATHGDYAGSATGETYWIVLEYTPDPDVLLRKLAKYDLGGICGDADRSGRVDIGDAVHMVNYFFAGGVPPADPAEGDYDCNGRTDMSDIVRLIYYYFESGPAPCDCR